MGTGKVIFLGALASALIIFGAVGANRHSTATPAVVEAPKPALPWGMTEGQVALYRSQAKFVTVQVQLGSHSDSSHNNTVKQQIEYRWPNFGEVVKTEDMGPLLGGEGTIIKATVRKHDCWD